MVTANHLYGYTHTSGEISATGTTVLISDALNFKHIKEFSLSLMSLSSDANACLTLSSGERIGWIQTASGLTYRMSSPLYAFSTSLNIVFAEGGSGYCNYSIIYKSIAGT